MRRSTQTFTRLGSLPGEISIVLSVKDKEKIAAADALPYDDNEACVVTLYPAAQKYKPDSALQADRRA